MRFIFFTKTNWEEPPRLRHQLAQLLVANGHEVHFFQNPFYPGMFFKRNHSGNERIHLYRYWQLIHHKLRLSVALHKFNAIFEKRQIHFWRKVLDIQDQDVIVNFNYEYFFLRDLFRQQRIITIINDDFWCRAILGYAKPLEWALTKTLKISDAVLTVSLPLKNQLSRIRSIELFYPWSTDSYSSPPNVISRNTILYWGYINNKLDFDFLTRLAKYMNSVQKNWKLLFVGPVECSIDAIKSFSNCTFIPSSRLEDLDLSDIFLGIIPYKNSIPSIDVITFPNKMIRLLAKGIPIAITGMPNFIEAPFIFRLDNQEEYAMNTIKQINAQFDIMQPTIREFVNTNTADARYRQFISCLNF